jgi:hypothetical protein
MNCIYCTTEMLCILLDDSALAQLILRKVVDYTFADSTFREYVMVQRRLIISCISFFLVFVMLN